MRDTAAHDIVGSRACTGKAKNFRSSIEYGMLEKFLARGMFAARASLAFLPFSRIVVAEAEEKDV